MEYNGTTQIFACIDCRDPLLVGTKSWRESIQMRSNIFIYGFIALMVILAAVTGGALN